MLTRAPAILLPVDYPPEIPGGATDDGPTTWLHGTHAGDMDGVLATSPLCQGA